MGWQDRDYDEPTWREPGLGRGYFRAPPRGTAVLLCLHAAAFILLLIITGRNQPGLAARLALSGSGTHPVGLLLHPLATREPISLLITLLVIWLLASRLEHQHGLRRTLGLYALGNLYAGVIYFLLARAWPASAALELDYPAGAFAAWCLTAYRDVSHTTVTVLGRVRRASHVAAFGLAAITALMLILHGLGAIAWLAALAGGAVAELGWHRWAAIVGHAAHRHRKPAGPHPLQGEPEARPSVEEPDIDDILAKISRSGLDSLTDEERRRLDAARRAKLQRSGNFRQ